MAKAVVLYGLETLVLLVEMEKKIERAHSNFLRQITGKQARRLGDRMWETPQAEGVREALGTQSEMTNIGRRQATVAQLVVLRPLFEVCTREKGYKGEGGEGSLGGDKWQQRDNFVPP